MSDAPRVRRADKLMPDDAARALLAQGHTVRVATVGRDGWHYVVPLLYVCVGAEVWVHNTIARGHFRENVDHDARVCVEIDVPGEVFPYGRFECDTSVAYRSVVGFGRVRIVERREDKQAFFDAFMAKYAGTTWERPAGFYPRLDAVTVYAIGVERLTGKETPLPAMEARWPALDQTKSPGAVAP
jgi:nitroimidazol reductase NimA-like FMN-containing flavoprotein (pyridoxamine 5'-phosphate oxidase superfamily)